jgi:hypothetical protein
LNFLAVFFVLLFLTAMNSPEVAGLPPRGRCLGTEHPNDGFPTPERIAPFWLEILVLRSCVVSWDKRFDRPVVLPDGNALRTLEDARRYILTLPKSEHETTAWQVAIEALLIAAEKRGRP